MLQCLAQTPYLIKVLDDLQEPSQKFVLPGGKLKISDDQEIELVLISNFVGYAYIVFLHYIEFYTLLSATY